MNVGLKKGTLLPKIFEKRLNHFKGMRPYTDAAALRQAEAVKMARGGEGRKSVCVSIKSGAYCESRPFCPLSTSEKFA